MSNLRAFKNNLSSADLLMSVLLLHFIDDIDLLSLKL